MGFLRWLVGASDPIKELRYDLNRRAEELQRESRRSKKEPEKRIPSVPPPRFIFGQPNDYGTIPIEYGKWTGGVQYSLMSQKYVFRFKHPELEFQHELSELDLHTQLRAEIRQNIYVLAPVIIRILDQKNKEILENFYSNLGG